MTIAIQLNLWDWLEEAAVAAEQMPDLVAVRDGITALDSVMSTITDASIPSQLSVAAEAFAQLSTILERKSEQWLNAWDAGEMGGLSLESDWTAGLVRQPVSFDLTSLVEVPPPLSKPKRQRPTADSSLAAPVAPDLILSMVEQLEQESGSIQSQLAALAGNETPSQWQTVIEQSWGSAARVRFSQLQQQTGLTPVELWLGLLLGGYQFIPAGQGQAEQFYGVDFHVSRAEQRG